MYTVEAHSFNNKAYILCNTTNANTHINLLDSQFSLNYST